MKRKISIIGTWNIPGSYRESGEILGIASKNHVTCPFKNPFTSFKGVKQFYPFKPPDFSSSMIPFHLSTSSSMIFLLSTVHEFLYHLYSRFKVTPLEPSFLYQSPSEKRSILMKENQPQSMRLILKRYSETVKAWCFE